MFGSILVALDGSDASQKALELARELAGKCESSLVLVNIVDLSKLVALAGYEAPYPAEAIAIMRADGKTALDAAVAACAAKGTFATPIVGEGDACDEILRIAQEQKVDLICLGTHGRSGISRLVLGSVAEGVLRRAHVPVLIAH